MSVVTYTDIPLKVFKKGKVRDVYEFGDMLLLIVTDRISAFDYVSHILITHFLHLKRR